MIRMLFVSVVLLLAPAAAKAEDGAFGFSFVSIEGAALPLSAYRDKAVLIVNTASFCGYTPQYDGLQAVWERYRDRGLVVLGVPSDDFNQEPGTAAEIKNFCEVNFNIDFPLSQKEHVTGAAAHPFYRWAEQQLGERAAPRWNFHKYLVAPDGRLVAWFPSATTPTDDEVTRAIEATLPGATR
jgi:glutathione peroxidase